MKKTLLTLVLVLSVFTMNSQSIFGKWKTVDDETGEVKSIVEIYERDGKVFGKVTEIFNKAKRNGLCEKCKGDKKNKPVLGMEIIDGLKKKGNEYSGGKIVNPENGKVYKCKIWLDESNKNKLNVRGYISFLYKTQTWLRAE